MNGKTYATVIAGLMVAGVIGIWATTVTVAKMEVSLKYAIESIKDHGNRIVQLERMGRFVRDP